jgi:regulator of protease activity HflC (stomatin/prohibitin superfamily)
MVISNPGGHAAMTQLAEFGNLGALAKRSGLLLVVGALIASTVAFRSCLLVVEQKRAAILVCKTGQDLPPGAILATDPSTKGIQVETLGEGWYLMNPYTWNWEVVDQLEVPAGKVGVRIRQYGDPLDPDQIIARDGQRGIVEKVLEPGRYRINPYADQVELHDAFEVPGGYLGVVTRLAGKSPKNPNVYVVGKGERGVQAETLPPGTYYLNPYAQLVTPIDTRSQKFDMNGDSNITFPSIDGFTITMEGTIEWYIERDHLAEVFVKYVDERKSANPVMECVVEKIILPNARSFSRLQGSRYLARELLGGATRQKFQEDFHRELAKACIDQGIVIREAVVRSIVLPDQISSPIRDRELAVRQRDKYTQEKEREKTEKELAMKKKLEERQRLITQAQAQVAVNITGAERKRDVALIEANRTLEVAKLELEAADNQAKAKISRGQADADVVRFQNKAAARGLADARAAFGDPDLYVRSLLYARLAPALRSILSNTDGPIVDILRGLTRPTASGGSVPAPHSGPIPSPSTSAGGAP